MTETEWLNCTELAPMLGHLRASKENRSRSGRRRLRLFGCGCGARVLRLMTERGRRWLELGEQLADELLDKEQRRKAESEKNGATNCQRADHLADSAAWFTLASNVMIAAEAAARSAGMAIEIESFHRGADSRSARDAEEREQVSVLRDIFDPLPFRAISIDPRWLTSTVLDLAQVIYDEKAFDRMPILADALMDSGCDSEEIIGHCRGEAPHVKGCWIIDLLLGKE